MRGLDFLSIGTNDLIQYTLAIDHTGDSVALDPLHPAVRDARGGHRTDGDARRRAGRVCGEMAGDLQLTRLLLGLGLQLLHAPVAASADQGADPAPTWPRCSARAARAAGERPGQDPRPSPKLNAAKASMKKIFALGIVLFAASASFRIPRDP